MSTEAIALEGTEAARSMGTIPTVEGVSKHKHIRAVC